MKLPILIADASPLIALARINQLDLLKTLFSEVLLTEAVYQEIMADNYTQHIHSQRIQQATDIGWLQVAIADYPASYSASTLMYVEGLDAGETSALLYADHLQAQGHEILVLIDEVKGRKIARQLHLDVIGSVGIIATAKQIGLIPAAQPLFLQLKAAGYYLSESVVAQGLAMAKED